MAVHCVCVVDSYSVLCIFGWVSSSLVLMLSGNTKGSGPTYTKQAIV